MRPLGQALSVQSCKTHRPLIRILTGFTGMLADDKGSGSHDQLLRLAPVISSPGPPIDDLWDQ